MSKKESRSKLLFKHEVLNKTIKDDKVVMHEELLEHREKGIFFKHYHKEGDKTEKFIGVQNEDGTFNVRILKDGEESKMEGVSKSDLLKMLAKDSMMKFALEYLKKQKGGKRKSRKGSRRGSRKGSRKAKRSTRKNKKSSKTRKSKKGSRKTKKSSKRRY